MNIDDFIILNFEKSKSDFILVSKLSEVINNKFPEVNKIVFGRAMAKNGFPSVIKRCYGKRNRVYFVKLLGW